MSDTYLHLTCAPEPAPSSLLHDMAEQLRQLDADTTMTAEEKDDFLIAYCAGVVLGDDADDYAFPETGAGGSEG